MNRRFYTYIVKAVYNNLLVVNLAVLNRISTIESRLSLKLRRSVLARG